MSIDNTLITWYLQQQSNINSRMVEQLNVLCTFWTVECFLYILNGAFAYSPVWCYSFNLSPCMFIYEEDKVQCCLVWNIYFLAQQNTKCTI